MLTTILLIIGSYCIGSCSAAILVCKWMGLPDPRQAGSHNPGATNVLRLGGKKAAALTLLGDVLKGMLPVAVAKFILDVQTVTQGLVALAVFLGHLYPVFFGFRGGKGVATAFGALFPLSWLAGLCTTSTWFVIAAIFRFSSLAALTAAISMPVYIAWLAPKYFPYVGIMGLFLIIRHKENLRRLWRKEESKIHL